MPYYSSFINFRHHFIKLIYWISHLIQGDIGLGPHQMLKWRETEKNNYVIFSECHSLIIFRSTSWLINFGVSVMVLIYFIFDLILLTKFHSIDAYLKKIVILLQNCLFTRPQFLMIQFPSSNYMFRLNIGRLEQGVRYVQS